MGDGLQSVLSNQPTPPPKKPKLADTFIDPNDPRLSPEDRKIVLEDQRRRLEAQLPADTFEGGGNHITVGGAPYTLKGREAVEYAETHPEDNYNEAPPPRDDGWRPPSGKLVAPQGAPKVPKDLFFNDPTKTAPAATQPKEDAGFDPSMLASTLGGGGHGAYEAHAVSDPRQEALDENYDQAGHLAAHQAYAESGAEGAKAEGLNTMANATGDAANQIDEDARHRRADAEMNDAYQQKALDHLLHQPGIDQDRLWNNMSTAAKVGTTIAAGLAGFGMGWNHEQGPNPVVQSLKERIQNDIHAQEEDFRRKDAGWEKKSQLFAHAYAVTGDYNQARKLAFDMGLQSVANRVKAIDHSSAQPVIKAHGAQLVNEIDREKILMGIKNNPMIQAAAASKGFTMADLIKRVHELTDHGDANGKPLPPKEAYRRALQEMGMATGGGPLQDISKGPKADPNAAKLAYAEIVDKEGQDLVSRPDAGSTNWHRIETWFQNTPEAERERTNETHDEAILEVVKNNLGGRATPDQIQKIASPFFMSREYTKAAPSPERMVQAAQLFHDYQTKHAGMTGAGAGAGDDRSALDGLEPNQ